MRKANKCPLPPTVTGGFRLFSAESAFNVWGCFYGTLVNAFVLFQGDPGKAGAAGYRGDEGPPGPEVSSMGHTHTHTRCTSGRVFPISLLHSSFRGQTDREESKDLPETEAQWAPRLVWEADVPPFLLSDF